MTPVFRGSFAVPATRGFALLADRVSRALGHPLACGLATLIILLWAITGPLFNYSDTWQLVINTGTTIVTFLMVFILQHSQNRDGLALQAKLDALIKASNASNRYIRIDESTLEEIEAMRERAKKE